MSSARWSSVVWLIPIFWMVGWAAAPGALSAEGKRIVFLAGKPSHGYGSHEHLAGCRILANAIERAQPGIKCDVIAGGWPESDNVLDGADAIVMYCDGGGNHPALQHLPALEKQIQRGAGFSCLHYAVEVPKDKGGPQFLDWLGGYFETHWSVNPHWTAEFKSFPEHPATRGVKPFSANDEWYFHMRFRPEMRGVTPLLSAVAPPTTMTRPDGPHSGNPDVRAEVAKGIPQHTAWVYQRPDGGRSFGFTGGHFHWNWGRPDIIRLVCNAICWTAKVDIPASGLAVDNPTVDTLKEGQDEPIPAKFDAEKIREEFKLTTGANQSKPQGRAVQRAESQVAVLKGNGNQRKGATPRLLYASPLVTTATRDHRVDAQIDVRGVKKLFLVVEDGGDSFACDWADWLNPILTSASKKQDLTELDWVSAQTQWGEVRKQKNAGGGPLIVGGKSFDKGIGTHASSVIQYNIGGNWETLQVSCGLDAGGTQQAGGKSSSVKFAVYADAAPAAAGGQKQESSDAVHARENALAGLDIHPALQATLAAAEPELLSLTNMDIDHRGRVWVCEVVNYRRHKGERQEGDRILILEDTNQDGKMDQQKVFYQGPDVDSAMGICVLGNKVIVSASPNIWVFTDDNGDDVPERKELLFTKTGDAQHDHSAHSFSFGPDGKLYWNFGNTGHTVHDAQGNIVRDMAGNEVRDSGTPYRQGMPFRCNLDGSQFEVLGYNFRNNYEVAVDSFGSLWQSDNDDDGNRATRINFVMEFGNYGYVDEKTGEGWRVERSNLEAEIPQQHWHLNDPGVVPTMLITGAGSPTGITVYEGDLLPAPFRNQVLHCDAGPNVVRAYPVTSTGAGYKAEIVDMMVGQRDRWFRPADVCVAPDGSVFVTDWYDPGVGGHNMQDMERGRLFRLAPPGAKYSVPKFDFTNPQGAVAALVNPNNAVRYLAFTALQSFGDRSVAPLQQLAQHENPRMRARAIWALGKLPGQGEAAVKLALADKDSDVRTVSIRLARQLQLPLASIKGLAHDSAAAVRRELAIALRFDKTAEMPGVWSELASQYDGRDRWYLEALGIGADLRWSECFDAYAKQNGNRFDTPAARDIVWRARCPKAAAMVADMLVSTSVADGEIPRYFRALDFQSGNDRNAALKTVLVSATSLGLDEKRQDQLVVETLLRLQDTQQELTPAQLDTVTRYLARCSNRAEQLKILRQLRLPDTNERLLGLVQSAEPDSQSVAAMEALLRRKATKLLLAQLSDSDHAPVAQRVATVLGMSKLDTAGSLINESLDSTQVIPEAKTELAKSLANSDGGARMLLARAKAGSLPPGARLLVGARLRASGNAEIRSAAQELFPAPAGAAKQPLPPVSELISKSGDAQRGLEVFKLKGTCANCHIVNGSGKNVGPDLSEIGGKLSREAMLVAILDPSAGISHNFENYAALTTSGQVVNGLLVSRTDAKVVLKDAQGIERTVTAEELEQFKKLDKSLMPDNLHENLTADELVDLMEYLMSLRKKQ